MAEEATRSRLGRGLAALIGDVGAESSPSARAASGDCRSARCGRMRATRGGCFPIPNLMNSRLAARARHHSADRRAPAARRPDMYEIIAGERRWRAAQRAGLHEVPVVVIEATDGEALQLAIVENVSAPISIRSKRRKGIAR